MSLKHEPMFIKSESGSLLGRFCDGPAESQYAMLFHERIKAGASETRYLTGFFDVAVDYSHEIFKILFFRLVPGRLTEIPVLGKQIEAVFQFGAVANDAFPFQEYSRL